MTPDSRYVEQLADAFAALHAHRWGEARLHEIGLSMPQRQDFERYVGHVSAGLEPMLAQVGEEIGPAWCERLGRIVARLADRYAERARDPRAITQIDGDANPGNVLVPRDGAGRIVLIDRQPFDWSLTRWLGASDLVYAMVPWWNSELRRRLEMQTLRRYHAVLQRRGIEDYRWRQRLDDYRLCIVETLMVAIEWNVLPFDRERMRWLWREQLRRAMAAFDDLRCDSLWDRPALD